MTLLICELLVHAGENVSSGALIPLPRRQAACSMPSSTKLLDFAFMANAEERSRRDWTGFRGLFMSLLHSPSNWILVAWKRKRLAN
ncbi:hypothetical protein NPIL_216771 [Nephila pilipes]|uniref:Uncharacterized protein n=1 Tax=Nephila pilipes TaxID=299642 RepID=A0A8X6P1N8_NEPPI|nr:hypothetical protein NPIL_216771 [Nephila pilipes]